MQPELPGIQPGPYVRRVLTLAILVLAQTPQHRLFMQPNLPRSSLAFFEAFSASGAGTSGPCSTTAPIGARGEVLTFTRASNGTCTKTATGGLATTGIADGDLVSLTNNVARVMYDSDGVLGLGVEAQGINLLPRYNDLTNAAWADVGTPSVVDGAADPFGGVTGDTIDDNNAAAYEGRSQAVTTTATSAYYAYCYVKAGTLAKARVLLDGTAATITGLSATTWSILAVADASASGASVSFQVMNGDAVTDTGTVIWGGCDVKLGTYRTSIVPTVAASATRVAERAIFTLPVAVSTATGSHAVSMTPEWSNATGALGYGLTYGANASPIYGVNDIRCYDSTTQLTLATTFTAGSTIRLWSSYTGSTQTLSNSSTSTTGAFDGAMPTTTSLEVGSQGAGANVWNAIYSRICADNEPTRCR